MQFRANSRRDLRVRLITRWLQAFDNCVLPRRSAIAVEISSVSVQDRADLDRMMPGIADAIASGIAAFRPSYVIAGEARCSARGDSTCNLVRHCCKPSNGAPK